MTGTTGGMVGGGYYDANSSFQAKVAASGDDLLERAVKALIPDAGGAVTVADYGCSEGRNSMATISRSLALLSAGGAADIAVVHNDLPTNDWAVLAANLVGEGSYLREFPTARALFAPHGFFERVTLPASVTLGTSASAAHWLSEQPPGIDMPRSLYRSDAPPAQLAKILAQAASDWEAFLAARAEELQPGGVLLVQMLGSDGSVEPVRVSAAGLLKLMNECALALVDGGEIPSDVYARYCFPVVPRTVAEATAPVTGVLADRLELLHCGLTPDRLRPTRWRSTRRATGRPSRRTTPPSPGRSAKAACAGRLRLRQERRRRRHRPFLRDDGGRAGRASGGLSLRRPDAGRDRASAATDLKPRPPSWTVRQRSVSARIDQGPLIREASMKRSSLIAAILLPFSRARPPQPTSSGISTLRRPAVRSWSWNEPSSSCRSPIGRWRCSACPAGTGR